MKKLETLMFKKIEVWVLFLILLFCFIGVVLFAGLLQYHYTGGKKFQSWQAGAVFLAELPQNIIKVFNRKSHMMALTVSKEPRRFSNKAAGFNIYNYDKAKDIDLLLVLSRTNYENTGQVVEVVDLKNFSVIKKFENTYSLIKSIQSEHTHERSEYIFKENSTLRSPFLTRIGDLIFISNSNIIIKISDDEQLVWFNDQFEFHHTFFVNEDENYIWAIGCAKEKSIPSVFLGEDFCDDSLIKIDLSSGKIEKSISLTKVFIKHNLHNHLFIGRLDNYAEDPLHINDVEEVSIESPYFKKKQLFLSLGHINTVLLLDPDTENIIWKISDNLFHQHDVDILNASELAIFNNNRVVIDKDKTFKNNEINIYDFETNTLTSPYNNFLYRHDVRTISQGLQEFTEYGIFVEEQNYGRLLLFDGIEKDLIFEYINRGNDGRDYQLHWTRIIKDKEKINFLRDLYR